MLRVFIVGVLGLTILLAGAGRQPAGPADMKAGDAAFQKEAWQDAADRYRAAEAAGLDHALLHFRLGYSLHMLKRIEEALPHHLKAAQITHRALRVDALYNVACAYALLGKRDEALRYLQYAVDAGFADANQLKIDTDMDPLRDDPAFRAIAGGGVLGQPRLAQRLDFLLGTWESRDAQGAVTQTITFTRPLEKSSAIVTAVTNAGGGEWTGLLAPDARERTWVWTQADGIGTTLTMVGTPLEGGGIRFQGRYRSAAGDGAEVRLTYSLNDDGGVTETAEVVQKDGTWRVHHEERMTRRGPPGGG